MQKCHLSQTNQGTLASSEFVQSQGKTSFPGGSDGKEYACSAGDLGSIPGLGRSPGEGKWQPTPVLLPGDSQGQSGLGAAVYGVSQS